MVSVGDSSVRAKSGRNAGSWNCGNPAGMPPKRLPTVASGNPVIETTAVPATSATMYPGTRGTTLFQTTMSVSTLTPTAAVGTEMDARFIPSTLRRPTNSPGIVPGSVMPRKSCQSNALAAPRLNVGASGRL